MKSPKKKIHVSEKARDRKSRAFSFVGNNRTPIRARFGAAVRARREDLQMTQVQLATLARVNRTYLSEIENGRETVSLERAERLAHALGCKLVDLLGEG